MQIITWSEQKNAWLKEHRGVSFEQVALLIEQGKIIEVFNHPDQDKYPGQRIAAVELGQYVLLVPFDKDGDVITLRTVIPSRKFTKKHLRGTQP